MRDLKSQKAKRTQGNRRKRKKEPRDWKAFFHRLLRAAVVTGSGALILSGALLTVRLVSDSDFFRIDGIRVSALQRVSREEVLSLSDIRPGMSMFDLDLASIGRKIEENPWVASASVQRIFPREVAIAITEREPMAIVNLGYLYYADASGEIFKLLSSEDRLDYPLITGLDREALLEDPEAARRGLREAMTLLKELAGRKRFNLDDVSELHIGPMEEFVLYTYRGGVPIRMGVGNFPSKLDRLEHIYRELEPRLSTLQHIDLNVADRVIVKLEANAHRGQG